MQNCDLIGSFESELEQKWFVEDFSDEPMKYFVKLINALYYYIPTVFTLASLG